MPTHGSVRTRIPIEVRYAETDQMGVVHHANYLVWFELARTDYCRQRGLRYTEIERRGYLLMVVGADLKYRRPVRYGDIVQVECAIGRYGSRGLTFGYRVSVDGHLAASGSTDHVWVDAASRRPVTVPDFARPYFDHAAEDDGEESAA